MALLWDADKPDLPCITVKKPQSVEGAPRTRHLKHSDRVPLCEHGRPYEGCQGGWEVGKGDPNETPKPSRGVG